MRRGTITCFLGSMKSSKTSELLKVLDQSKFRSDVQYACLIRPQLDTRDFVSRTVKTDNSYDVLTCSRFLMEIYSQLSKYSLICIDEGHFLLDLGPVANRLALQDKEVYIAALNGDSDMRPWDSISNLIPYCDYIERTSGVCECCGKNKPTFTFYKGVKDGQIVIGDTSYNIYCKSCWEKNAKEI